jgi:hypothetical protein
MAVGPVNPQAMNLATAFRGLYARIASRLDVDPSYVSRVARGERKSRKIVNALDREMRQVMKVLEFNHAFGQLAANHNGSSRKGISRRRVKKTERAA